MIGKGDVCFNRCERAIVVRGRDVVGLEVFAFDEDGIHRFSASEVDVQYRFPTGSLDNRGYIAVDDAIRVGGTRKRYGDAGSESFGFCEQIHHLCLVLFAQDSLQCKVKEINIMQSNNLIISALLALLLILVFGCSQDEDTPTKLTQNDANPAFLSGLAYYVKGDYDNAIKDFTKSIKLKSDYFPPYHQRGRTYYITGETKRAIKDFTKTIKIHPKFVEAYYERGRAYFVKGDYKRAIKDFTKATELKPNYAEAYYQRGRVHYKIEDKDLAIADCTKAIELKPDYAEAYMQRGDSYSNDDYSLTIKDYEKAEELRGDGRGYRRIRMDSIWLNKEKGIFDNTIKNLTQALETNPNDPQTLLGRGWAYHCIFEDETAIVDYTKAIKLKPDSTLAYFRRGMAYSTSTGGNDNAIADFTQVIQLDADNAYPGAYFARGLAYDEKKNYKRAIEDYTKTIELKPNYAEAYDQRGMVHFSRGDYNHAIENFTSAIELDYWLISSVYSMRSSTLARMGDFVRANADRAISEKIEKAR